jgi:phosphotransferase system HPr-like phosphotransfer protein
MELYLNSTWTERCANASSSYLAEAIAWSENGNHVSIYATGSTAEEADTKLLNALRELKLVPETAKRVEPTA